MRRGVTILVLALSALSVAGAQTLPKLPKVRVPSNLPGGSKLNTTINKSPRQHAAEARRDEVQQLMSEAIATEDPNERASIYAKILVIDPNNTVAYQGWKDALDEAEQQKLEQQQQEQQVESAAGALMEQERKRREAVKQAEEALLREDVEAADEHLRVAEEIQPDDPETQRLRVIIDRKLSRRVWTRRLLIAGAVLVGVGLLAWLIIYLRRRDPYLEIISGPRTGERVPFDGKLFRIGAVAADGSDNNDLVLSDDGRLISRFHCEIHRRGNQYFLIDLDSANGTFLGRQRLKPGRPARLKRGAHVGVAGAAALRLGFERRKGDSR